jgi:OmpA-OmpF porin, OOP family
MKMHRSLARCLLLASFLAPLPAGAATPTADMEGAADPPGIKRYAGSVIFKFSRSEFESHTLPTGRILAPGRYENAKKVEGKLTRVSYLAPEGRSAAEVFRNYQQDLQAAGFETLFEADHASLGTMFGNGTYESLGQFFAYSPQKERFLAARRSTPQGEQHIGLYVTEFEGGFDGRIEIPVGRAIAQLDLVESKPMEQRMVLVRAEEMSQSLGDSGKIAIYGIYFDFNKADIKPESAPTLAEIAKLMRPDPARKLLVVGHTDSVGGMEFNTELSRRRAESVVRALVSQHGIDASRLTPAGVGYLCPVASNRTDEGRAKNRRVELVEF